VKYFLTILIALFPVYAAYGQGNNDVYADAAITSKHLIPGETTNLIIRLRGGKPDGRPAVPVVEGSAINFVRTVTQIDQQRNLSQVYLYRVTPAIVGKFTIPPVTLSSGGKPLKTPALNFHVHAIDELIPLATGIDKQIVLAGWFPEKKTLYQGEQCPITLKLYAPQKLRIASWGMPDPIKKNCLAWRFSLPPRHEIGQVHINGIPHLSAIYDTTLSGISPGIATFGPSKLTLIVRSRVIDPRFGSRISDNPVELTLPALNFNILPFPQGAPDDFQGAIGQFQIEAQCKKLTIGENDTTEVTLRVAGIGNLETLKAPVLSQDTWKIIDTAKVTRGTERRYVRGMVTFNQIIRSRGIQPSIPAYSFSYFNPNDKSYHTLTTPPIPVSITPAPSSSADAVNRNSISERLGTDPEEMRDILGFINKPALGHSKFNFLNSKFIHIAPALLCLLIIAFPLWRKLKSSRITSPHAERQLEALKKLSAATDTRTFYRRAGRFIDQWLSSNDKLETILAERDAVCFQPEETELETIEPNRKNEIIKLLKNGSKLALTLLFLLTCLSPVSSVAEDKNSAFTTQQSTLNTARDAWKIGQYQQAIDLYQKAYPDPSITPADILFNIGNCHYRLIQFGHAALAWRRTLAVDSTHQQARQNLRYLETEKGAITPELHTWQQHIPILHTQVYRLIFLTSLWILLISLLTLIFLKPHKKIALITLTFLIPIPLTLGALGVYYYPDSDFHTPYGEQAVSLKKTPLYKEAHREEKHPLSLPEASLFHVLAIRGPWIHIETPDGQSGWVQSHNIGIIMP